MEYELMLILKPLLPEDVKSGLMKQIEGLIKKFKGKILSSDVWGKRHLAYPIKKHEEGYYVIYKISMNQSESAEFDRELKLTNGVLRFLKLKESEL